MNCRYCGKEIKRANLEVDNFGNWYHTESNRCFCSGDRNTMAMPSDEPKKEK